jgi:hypothetical protein
MEMPRKLTVSMLRDGWSTVGNYLIGLAHNGDAEEADCVHVEGDGNDVEGRMETVIPCLDWPIMRDAEKVDCVHVERGIETVIT